MGGGKEDRGATAGLSRVGNAVRGPVDSRKPWTDQSSLVVVTARMYGVQNKSRAKRELLAGQRLFETKMQVSSGKRFKRIPSSAT